MNGNYYQNPTFPSTGYQTPPGNMQITDVNKENYVYNEQSYIENILRLNKGKIVKAYVSFPDATEWKNKIFEGRIEQAGRDHLIISNPENGEWYLILMIYLNYVEFEEKINYSPDFTLKAL